ncbi:branched-chain amino acid ABC transporter permease [Aeromicrobium wangtongii]|uniref:Branched-chain amino acid ABC transporter permease n=1 Tax=Aeromicrobium wangtongii TaxID=2969247 RepID=A0ABY5M6C2_9ACTN|nr:branched-chain amino acid ABC transporter permease [Aeromicrobium wangtongii]MCD9199360.1 branched-chain amino acid ABC transporter permease [Aeromicrobium wangtongii]MCL3817114.1 branched-chain amino acid ABC transporter permease [Aeromicrobium wangtongii]UUP13718.1 branched-chain amino acid ABC transporter permease [Aeromicrobium wangtongii]
MDRFVFLTIDGISRGAVFAAFALALVLIWRGARLVNFSQGAMAAASTFVAYSVTSSTGSYWLGLVAATLSGLVIGAGTERLVMRHVDASRPLNAVIVALGVVLVIQAVLGIIYGSTYRPMAIPFSRKPLTIGDQALLSPYDIFVLTTVVAVMAGLGWMFTRTDIGLTMRAAAFNPDMARLLGVDVGRMLTLSWGLAGAVGGLAALLIVPTELGAHPHSTDLVFVYAFTAAVVGGLDSPVGAVVGGLGIGLVLSYVSGYSGSDISAVVILGLLTGVLLLRPAGLFSRAAARAV